MSRHLPDRRRRQRRIERPTASPDPAPHLRHPSYDRAISIERGKEFGWLFEERLLRLTRRPILAPFRVIENSHIELDYRASIGLLRMSMSFKIHHLRSILLSLPILPDITRHIPSVEFRKPKTRGQIR